MTADSRCTTDGCGDTPYCKGLCTYCYRREREGKPPQPHYPTHRTNYHQRFV